MFKVHSLCSKKDIPSVQRRTFLVFAGGPFLVFEKRFSLGSEQDIPSVRGRTFHVFEDDETPIFGRTDLRKGVSEAKFDAEVDFDVQKCLAPPKSPENHEKLTKNSEKKNRKFFFGIEKSKIANHPKRVFPKFRGNRSEVRGANGRSKFQDSVDSGAY